MATNPLAAAAARKAKAPKKREPKKRGPLLVKKTTTKKKTDGTVLDRVETMHRAGKSYDQMEKETGWPRKSLLWYTWKLRSLRRISKPKRG